MEIPAALNAESPRKKTKLRISNKIQHIDHDDDVGSPRAKPAAVKEDYGR